MPDERRRLPRMARYLWAGPCTLVGLFFAAVVLGAGGTAQRVCGVLEVALRQDEAAPAAKHFLPFSAITLGHVIIGRYRSQLAALRDHEHVHVRQYERWGLTFFIAYPVSSLVQLLRGRNPYWHNRFEVEAYAATRPAHEILAKRSLPTRSPR